MLKMQLSVFKELKNGSQIAFLPSDCIEEFYKSFVEFFNNSLNLSEKEIRESKQRAKNDGFFVTNDKSKNFSEVSETGLVFFNPNSGTEIVMAINSAFPMPLNPYFKEEDSLEHVMHLLMDQSISTELVNYCLDNCKTKLSFFKEGVGNKYLNDIDFLLRFWKKDNYYSIPSVTYTGQKEEKTSANT